MSEVSVLSLGGLKEIGARNCHLIVYKGQALMLDCGQKVPDDQEHGDHVLPPEFYPDFRFLFERNIKVSGVCLSHGHFDHSAATPHFYGQYRYNYPASSLPIVFASSHTKRILRIWEFNRVSLDTLPDIATDKDMQIRIAGRIGGLDIPCFDIRDGERFTAGHFEVVPFDVIHSIPGALGFAIYVGGKCIVYTGDFKLSGESSEVEALEATLDKLSPDALLIDSTGVGVQGTSGADSIASDAVCEIIDNHPNGRVIITGFSSHTDRWKRIINYLHEHYPHRQRIIVGRSLYRFFEAASLDENFCDRHDNSDPYFTDDAVIFMTGSQAEEWSAMWRLVEGELPGLALGDLRERDAIVISASTIPVSANETRVRRIMQILRDSACELHVIEDNPLKPDKSKLNIGDYHVSGHASWTELQRAVALANPKLIIPVHGGEVQRRKFMEDMPQRNVVIAQEGVPVIIP